MLNPPELQLDSAKMLVFATNTQLEALDCPRIRIDNASRHFPRPAMIVSGFARMQMVVKQKSRILMNSATTKRLILARAKNKKLAMKCGLQVHAEPSVVHIEEILNPFGCDSQLE